ncbi:hypothetical protein [Pelotomaculum sp. PtaB.Bin117]|uniref:hypothetical protein n=1 Tax=Pelotomaculum sp. PtaB.Bin117 TaxID=1811694 RepID=UPI0009D2B3AD|nr:hypothetical protein [Pelotomaculum sp. PtaB.Bin117]OPX84584.1 MAG: hypothetical protein A4E54_02851 [Pelotomaculum sp. PtaB.Bin117]OPY61563.1 MAG: hypothetical protein A4E56_01981 [Pelotomaculum sp. PtaU1.Bin065]
MKIDTLEENNISGEIIIRYNIDQILHGDIVVELSKDKNNYLPSGGLDVHV